MFVNVLLTAFTLVDTKGVKDTDDFTVFFTLSVSGSTSIKAAHKMFAKLIPDRLMTSKRTFG